MVFNKKLPSLEKAGYNRKSIISIVFEVTRFDKLTPGEKDEYRKSILDYADIRDVVEFNREMASEEGYERGMQASQEQGMQQGMQQGLREAQLKYAKEMVAAGLDQQTIANITGLSLAEIEALS